MSSDVNLVNVGAVANDGTGDAIRSAFQTVNSNFSNIDSRISTGNFGVVYSGTYIQANLSLTSLGSTTSNTLAVASTANIAGNTRIANLTVNNSFISTTITSTGNTNAIGGLTVTGPAQFVNNVVITGNLTVLGNSLTTSSVDLVIDDSLINLHSPSDLSPLVVDDGKDIGIKFHYYKGADRHAALVWANDSQALEFYANGLESSGNTFSGTYGNVKIGSLFAGNTTQSTSSTTGAIVTRGGLGVASNTNVGGNLTVSGNTYLQSANVNQLSVSGSVIGSIFLNGGDTVYVDGSPVATSAGSFTGGTVPNYTLFNTVLEARGNIFANSNVQSISTTTGAIVVGNVGGLGVGGNIYAGGIQNTPIGTATAAVGNFTTLKSSGNIVAGSGLDAVSVTNAALVVKGGLGVSGNVIIGGSINNTSIGVYGAAVGNFTTINAAYQSKLAGNLVAYSNTPSGNVSTGAVVVVGGLGVSGNVNAGAVYSDTYKFANGVAYYGTTLANTIEISANAASSSNVGLSLVTTGVVAGTYGNATYAPTYTVDSKGRLSSSGTQRNYHNVSGTTGTAELNNQGTLTFSGTYGVTVSVNGSATANIATPQDLRTTASPTFLNITVGNIAPAANNVSNIGSIANQYNTIFARATSAAYADLAEKYTSDSNYPPGTVLVFGGDAEVTVTTEFADTRVAGAVTTNPAYLMNAELNGVAIALRGRIPINVYGPVTKGDLLVTSSTVGCAVSVGNDKSYGPAVFAKALQDKLDDDIGQIEAVIL